MLVKGTIFDIQRFSLHDGPGIRTTLFLKGCPLKCLWCHNPESINPMPELFFSSERCATCGKCVEICENKAISIKNGVRVYSSCKCELCGKCVNACHEGALSLAGYEISTDEVILIVKKDLLFYKKSLGGLTLSGGEPLLQHKFALDILQKAKALGIHTCVDTTAYRTWESIQEIVPLVDLFLIDLKSMQTGRHKELTGVDNGIILENIRQLLSYNARIIIRVPVITVEAIEILPYNKMAKSKYLNFGKPYLYENLETQSPEKMEEIVRLFDEIDIPIKVGWGFSS